MAEIAVAADDSDDESGQARETLGSSWERPAAPFQRVGESVEQALAPYRRLAESLERAAAPWRELAESWERSAAPWRELAESWERSAAPYRRLWEAMGPSRESLEALERTAAPWRELAESWERSAAPYRRLWEKVAPSRESLEALERTAAPWRELAESWKWTSISSEPVLAVWRADVQALDGLVESARFFSTFDAEETLREESEGILADPVTWLAATEEAAEAGDKRANTVLLLVQYLFGCFLLVTRRLDPSARAIERFGSLIALSVFLMVVVGSVNARDPRLLGKWNEYLSTPLGIIGLYLALRPAIAARRPRRNKPSLHRRGGSKPRRKTLRRFRQR